MIPQRQRAHIAQCLLAPRAIALIGASDDPKRLTSRPQRFLTHHGYKGAIYPVNPNRKQVLGVDAFRSVSDIGAPIDLAYILTGTAHVEAALRDCIAANVPVVSVLADGFADAGESGREREARLKEMADESGTVLLGPNAMGLVASDAHVICTTNAAFSETATIIPGGRVAVISQSGSVIGAIASRGHALGLGYAALVSTGNEAQSGIGEVGQYLVARDEIDCFLLFIESIRRPDAVAAFAIAAAEAGKPIAAYVLGQSDAGRALAVTHTGAMTTSADATIAFLRAYGVRVLDTLDALISAPPILTADRRNSAGVAVVTTTGGGGAMLVDRLARAQTPLCRLTGETIAALDAVGVSADQSPLVDVTLAGANPDTMRAVMTVLSQAPEVGLIAAVIGSSAQFSPEIAVTPMIDAYRTGDASAPSLVAVPLPSAPEALSMFADAGIAAFRSVETAADVIGEHLTAPNLRPDLKDRLQTPTRAAFEAPTTPVALDEVAASERLGQLGIAFARSVVVAPDDDIGASIRAAGLKCQLVVKAVSADLPHKSELGAVRTGLATVDAVGIAVSEIAQSIAARAPHVSVKKFLIQEHVAGLGEAIVGYVRDPSVGPMVTVGAGGVLAELYADRVIEVAPVDETRARDMVDRVVGLKLLAGYRGLATGDLDALATIVSQISRLADDRTVIEAEINPVIVGEDHATAVDALMISDVET